MAYLFWIITLVLFSSLEVVSKPIMGQIDPFTMTFLRFFIGGLFLFILTLFTRRKTDVKMEKKDLLYVILVGCLNCIISMTLLQLSVKSGNASSAAVLISTNPIFTALFARFIAGERLSRKKLIGIGLGLGGILTFSFGMLEGDSLIGIVYGLSAAVTFALYSVLMKKPVKKYGSLRCTAYSGLFPSLIYGVALAASGNMNIPLLDLQGWLIVLYLGIFVTGIAYFTMLESIKRIGASNTMRLFYVKPVLASILAVLFLGEALGVLKITGMAIIIFSLFL
ncbi:MAG TPA: EamA family transporter [Thermotogota bacterium]|nr:EamA family transporter [Thermotogota bacterium]